MSATPGSERRERPPRPRLGLRDRLFAWLVTGPLGRLAAFFADLAAVGWRWARRREPPTGTR